MFLTRLTALGSSSVNDMHSHFHALGNGEARRTARSAEAGSGAISQRTRLNNYRFAAYTLPASQRRGVRGQAPLRGQITPAGVSKASWIQWMFKTCETDCRAARAA